ncbi:MAG: hypothetical protein AAB250_05525, partial [Bdellovibrionota bacterium]
MKNKSAKKRSKNQLRLEALLSSAGAKIVDPATVAKPKPAQKPARKPAPRPVPVSVKAEETRPVGKSKPPRSRIEKPRQPA